MNQKPNNKDVKKMQEDKFRHEMHLRQDEKMYGYDPCKIRAS